ncbi:hypothetical protein [Bacillus mycoides]|uniref:hypothetical protein n=1 Tax=Bacillus mycoides TaxID=1405 RepID=UPI000A27BED3|nr:hypothetical protein [Bacillus mycoides]OSX92015.1 hypothetical protein BTJ44_01162 [Bacillus mycoides]
MGRKDELILYLIKNEIYKFNKYQLWELNEEQLEKLIKKLNQLDETIPEMK